ncbi:MAG TPA: TIM barrel protein [Phycisphaerae bacterium]|nr:TIM barrel protein [Phycisphaerae bacterium]
MKRFCIGVDSYSLQPLALSPLEVLDWVYAHGGEGVQFSDVQLKADQRLDEAFLRELRQRADQLGLYLEWGGAQHIPLDLESWQPKDILPINIAAARQAAALGTRVVRSCSGGLMRWNDAAPPTETLLREMARALKVQEALWTDLDVVLAIELHFEFTTFELLRVFEMCGAKPGGWLGVCLDTMNLLTMLEEPVAGTERILPWVVATHIKDGAMTTSPAGLVSFTTPIGDGLVDFERICRLLATLERPVHLSIEDHGGSFDIPVNDPAFRARFPDLTEQELGQLKQIAHEGQRRIAEGQLTITDRGDWPRLCEDRVAGDIASLKEIVFKVERSGADSSDRREG